MKYISFPNGTYTYFYPDGSTETISKLMPHTHGWFLSEWLGPILFAGIVAYVVWHIIRSRP